MGAISRKKRKFPNRGLLKPDVSQETVFFEEERDAAMPHLADVILTRSEVVLPELALKPLTTLRHRRRGEEVSLEFTTKQTLLPLIGNILAELTLAAIQLAILIHTHLRLERYDTLSCPEIG